MEAPGHRPVMLREVLEVLEPRPGEVFVDATLGLGGHSRGVLERIAPGGRLLGIDRDLEALRRAGERLAGSAAEVLLHHGRFSQIREALRASGLGEEGAVNGILFDLGVSSLQLDSAERGFSFLREGPLDMRMDPSSGESARSLLGRLSVEEIAKILREYGEEPSARRIARAILRRRSEEKLLTTEDLARAVEEVLPRRGGKIHPATRTFQAVRIAVNQELEELRRALLEVDRFLAPGGRVAVLSYHSLEDRCVKEILRERFREGIFELPDSDPRRPTEEEIEENPRARSARLRSAKRRA